MTTDNTVTGVKLLQRRPAGTLYIAECNQAGVVLAAIAGAYTGTDAP